MPKLDIVHLDDHLAIVDKPAGVLVVPAPGRRTPTVVDLLGEQLQRRVQAVHRLDEDTTGALALALDDDSRAVLERAFRDHAVTREYLALVAATPSPAAGRIEANLIEGEDGVVRIATRGGQRAITHYETLGRRGNCTLVRCRLETGRRNQIRAHLAALGCPLAGDRKYGFRARAGERFARAMLHSWRMKLSHPILGVPVEVTVTPADEILRP